MQANDIIVAGNSVSMVYQRSTLYNGRPVDEVGRRIQPKGLHHDISNSDGSSGLKARSPQNANTSPLATTIVVVDVETTVYFTAPADAPTARPSSNSQSSPSSANASRTGAAVAPIATSALSSSLSSTPSRATGSPSTASSSRLLTSIASPSNSNVASASPTRSSTSSALGPSSTAAGATGQPQKTKFPTVVVACVVGIVVLLLLLVGLVLLRRRRKGHPLRPNHNKAAYKEDGDNHFGTSATSLVANREHISHPILGPTGTGTHPISHNSGYIPISPPQPPPIPNTSMNARMHPGTRIDRHSVVEDSEDARRSKSFSMNGAIVAGAAATAAAVAGFKINRGDGQMTPKTSPNRLVDPSTWLESATPSPASQSGPFPMPPTHGREPTLPNVYANDSNGSPTQRRGPPPLQWRPKQQNYGVGSPLAQPRSPISQMDPDAITSISATSAGGAGRQTRIEDFYAPWVREMMRDGHHSVRTQPIQEGDEEIGDNMRWSQGNWRR